MKAILSLLATVLLFCPQVVHAQLFSTTTGMLCENCHPADYSSSGSPSISDINRVGGNQEKYWYANNSLLPVPPSLYSQGLPAGGGKNSFVTLKTSEIGQNDILYLTVSGFDVNKDYTFQYSVLSAGVIDATNPNDPKNFPFGEAAKVTITTSGQIPVLVAEQTTSFTSSDQIKWFSKTLTFKPLTSILVFKFSGKTTGVATGYINFSVDKYPFGCLLQNTPQVELGRNTVNTIFPNDKLDLGTVQIKTVTPPNGELVWKTGPNSTDPTLTAQQLSAVSISNQDPNNVKPYYAFYQTKELNNCYNVPVSQAELKFMHVPTQVPLKNGGYVVLNCPALTADLTTLPVDPVGPVVWFTTENHQGNPVQNPQAVPPGHYYAFYFDLYKGGFSLTGNAVSIAHAVVENAVNPGTPDLGPTMSINSLIFPQNGSKDFVVRIQNTLSENSGCSVFFRVSKLPGFTISYSTQAGQSNVDGGIFNNNDLWTFSEDNNFITVTAKSGIASNGYSDIGFKITRKANTPANSAQNISVTIPQQGGGGEINTTNNSLITTVTGI